MSKYGSTPKIAGVIGRILAERGVRGDVARVEKLRHLDGGDAVRAP